MGGALRNISALVLTLAVFSQAFGSSFAEANFGDAVRTPTWRGRIQIAVSSSFFSQAPNIKSGSDVSGAIERSVESWRSASGLDISIERSAKQDVSPVGRSGDGVSLLTVAPTAQNTLIFGESESVPAKTRIFYSRRNFISEADIVLNPAVQFSTDGSYGTFDLETVLTHEIGHLLGLKHNFVPSSIMYGSVMRNGAFEMDWIKPSVSSVDIAELKSKYPGEAKDEDCCGVILGRASSAVRRDSRYEIWAADVTTGRVAASTTLSRGRTFEIEGLPAGRYEVFSRAVNAGKSFEVQSLGEVTIPIGGRRTLSLELSAGRPAGEIVAIGSHGLLADRVFAVDAGTVSTILVAIDMADGGNFLFQVDSPYIQIDPGSIAEVDYADGVRAFVMSVSVEDGAVKGDHTICVQDKLGRRSCLPGGLRVR